MQEMFNPSAPEGAGGEWVLVPRDAIERAIETLENDGDEHGEGRNLRAMLDATQQPAAVGEEWRKKAAEWLEAKAVEQEAANQRWPKHAACYKEWRDRPGILRHLAFQVLAALQGGDT